MLVSPHLMLHVETACRWPPIVTIMTGAAAGVAVVRAWALLRLLRRFPPGSGRSLSLLLAMRGPRCVSCCLRGAWRAVSLPGQERPGRMAKHKICRHTEQRNAWFHTGGYGNVLRQRMPKLDKWALNVVGGLVLPLTMAAEDEEVRPRPIKSMCPRLCRETGAIVQSLCWCMNLRPLSRPIQANVGPVVCTVCGGSCSAILGTAARPQMPGSQLHPDQEGDSRDDEKAAEERATGSVKGASSDADNSSPSGGAG